jgi:short-subunit dehydrogenase
MTASPDTRVVLVTGASAGIGRAAALAFAKEGATVLAVARRKELLERLAAEPDAGGRIVPMVADVADGHSMDALAAAVLARYRTPDILVANAGIALDARMTETSDAALEEILEVNVVGVFRTIRPFLRGMIARGSGRILVVSSIVGKRGTPGYTAYSASKFALHGMAEALRPELHGTGVTIGLICPSSTLTELDEMKRRVARHSAESVARAIVRMARSERREVILSAEAKLMNWGNHVAPGLVDWILAKALVKPR